MLKTTRAFIVNEHGSISVDWVVLAAGVIGIGLWIFIAVAKPVDNAAIEMRQTITSEAMDASTFPTDHYGQ